MQTTQSWVEASIDLNIAISENADLWTKSAHGEDLSEEELLAMKQLVHGWYRGVVSNAFQRRRLGSPGPYTLQSFAIQLYENPGAARIWKEITEDELRYLDQLNDDDGMRQMRDEILGYLAILQDRNSD